MCDPATALRAVKALGFTAEEESLILHDNAATLLGLSCAH